MLKKCAWHVYYVHITQMCKSTTDQLSLVVVVESVIGDAVVEIVLDIVLVHAHVDNRSSAACDTTIVFYISSWKIPSKP